MTDTQLNHPVSYGPTKLFDIVDPALFSEMIEKKFIKSQVHPEFPELSIYNYTDSCMWSQEWNEVTVTCRGLIVNNQTEEIVARSFNKFFNNDQMQAPIWSIFDTVQVTDKMDGSLGILYVDPLGTQSISTRGSFASDQALWATDLYRNKYAGTWDHNPEVTYLFEIIYPENKIVIDYDGVEDIVLIGGVHTSTGKSISVSELAKDWPGTTVDVLFDDTTLEQVVALAPRDNAEGFVLWNPITDERVKIKYERYKELHRFLTNTNAKHVWEILSTNQDPNEIFSVAPDEFHEWIRLVVSELKREFSKIKSEASKEYVDILKTLLENCSRKDFAQVAAKSAHKSILFKIYDEQPYDSIIWGSIKPSGTRTFRKVNSDAD